MREIPLAAWLNRGRTPREARRPGPDAAPEPRAADASRADSVGMVFTSHDDLDAALVGAEDELAGLADRFDLDDARTAELKALLVEYATHVAAELELGVGPRRRRAAAASRPHVDTLVAAAVATSDARELIAVGALTASRGGRAEDWAGLPRWFDPQTGRAARFSLRLIRALPGMHANLRRLHTSAGTATTRARALRAGPRLRRPRARHPDLAGRGRRPLLAQAGRQRRGRGADRRGHLLARRPGSQRAGAAAHHRPHRRPRPRRRRPRRHRHPRRGRRRRAERERRHREALAEVLAARTRRPAHRRRRPGRVRRADVATRGPRHAGDAGAPDGITGRAGPATGSACTVLYLGPGTTGDRPPRRVRVCCARRPGGCCCPAGSRCSTAASRPELAGSTLAGRRPPRPATADRSRRAWRAWHERHPTPTTRTPTPSRTGLDPDGRRPAGREPRVRPRAAAPGRPKPAPRSPRCCGCWPGAAGWSPAATTTRSRRSAATRPRCATRSAGSAGC